MEAFTTNRWYFGGDVKKEQYQYHYQEKDNKEDGVTESDLGSISN